MPSGSARASTTCRLSMPRSLPAPSPVWTRAMQKQPDAAPRAQTETPESGLKLAIELGPLLVFFGTNAAAGIYVATAVFMAATLVALGVAWWRYHKIPVMPLVSGAVVLVFGTLTLYLQDDTFIKLKPTIVYLTFAAFLGAGLLLRKPVLELLLGSVFNLTEPGWRKLTLRW